MIMEVGRELDGLLVRPAPEVAPCLLGAVLHHGGVSLRLTEVEAYAGPDDPASHAWRGPTPRSMIMFGPSGRLYVYLSYGLHHAANLVCGPDGEASAVLLRSGEVISGIDRAAARRGDVTPDRLARGPGNLAQALGLTRSDNGLVLGVGFALELPPAASTVVGQGPRVGVSRAADRPWRWWIPDDPTVSAYRRSPRADPRASTP